MFSDIPNIEFYLRVVALLLLFFCFLVTFYISYFLICIHCYQFILTFISSLKNVLGFFCFLSKSGFVTSTAFLPSCGTVAFLASSEIFLNIS